MFRFLDSEIDRYFEHPRFRSHNSGYRDQDPDFDNQNAWFNDRDGDECQFDMRNVTRPRWGGEKRASDYVGRASRPRRGNVGPDITNDARYLSSVRGSRQFCNDYRERDFEDGSRTCWERFEGDAMCDGGNVDISEEFLADHVFQPRRRPSDNSHVRSYEYNNRKRRDWREWEYQNESFNGTIQQLNQEPQVYLPPPPNPAEDYGPPPPPNNMYRGRGNWRHYHQNSFSHERDDRPYRRRRSHLDDIYFPNYEDDNDDHNESDNTNNNYHRERFDSRRINRWDERHRIPHIGHKRDTWRRCLIPTKVHTSVSKDCARGDKNKINNDVTEVVKQNAASDNSKKNVYNRDTNIECDNMKDLNTVRCLNNACEKDKESKIVSSKKNINKPTNPAKEAVSEISEDSGGIRGQNTMKTDTSSSKHNEIVPIRPGARADSMTNSNTSNNLTKHSADKSCINKENKTDDQSSTHTTSEKSVDLDTSLKSTLGEPSLDIDDDSRKLAEKRSLKITPHTPVSDERMEEESEAVLCHTLPSEFPTWKESPTASRYQNSYTSIREIESDEETVCYDHFITLENIDTTKSYLDKESFGPDVDDYRVTDMTMSTPSPVKRKCDEDYEEVAAKKSKFDRLYAEINSDQLLNEINEVLNEDKQKLERTSTPCIRRYRSKSLTIVKPEKKNVLPRCRSLNSIDQGHNQNKCNFDVSTNILMLLLESERPSTTKINGTNSIVKDTNTEKETTCKILEELDRYEKGLKSSREDVSKENEKEDVKEAKENKIESVNNETKEIANSEDIEIHQASEEIKKKKGVEETKNEVKCIQDRAAPVKLNGTCCKDADSHKVQTNIRSVEKLGQKEPRNISNDHGRDVDLKVIKSYGPIDCTRNVAGGSTDKSKKLNEDMRKERRANDEAKKDPGSEKFHQIDDNLGPSDITKKSSCLVRYSDYKKTVDLTKKTAPPEMSLCAILGSPKKLTSRRMAFSNEDELYLQKMKFKHLFGEDYEDEEVSNKRGDDKNDSKKRKGGKDVGGQKGEPQPKKLFSEFNKQCVTKTKSLNDTRRYSTPGPSRNEGDREPPNTAKVSKSTSCRQYSNNILQKTHSSSAIDKSKEPKDSNVKISHKSKSIDKSKRTSSSATPNGGNKYLSDKMRIPMPLCSVPQGTSSLHKTHKPEGDKKDKTSKNAKGESTSKPQSGTNSTQTTDTSKDEKCQLNVDVAKSQSRDITGNSSRTNPKVVENIPHKSPDVNVADALKLIDKNSRPSAVSRGDAKKDLHADVTPKTTADAQKDQEESLVVQKQSSQFKSDTGTTPINSTALQPQLVLNRIDDEISNAANEKELPIKNAIESSTIEPNYTKCSTLARDRFPMMQKIRVCETENECCDRATILEGPDVTNKMDTVKQVVTSSRECKESSDDVIEIKPNIPVIDLTEDGNDEKFEIPPKTDEVVKPDKKENVVDSTPDEPNTTSNEERITLYRSDETLNNSLELQATIASISPNVLRNGDGNKKPDDIKSDDGPAGAAEDKSAVGTLPTVSSLPVPGISTLTVPQDISVNKSKDLCQSLIERVINEALREREQQNPNSNINANTPQGSVSETNVPLTPMLKNALLISDVNATTNQMAPPPNSIQRNPTVYSPRRRDDATIPSTPEVTPGLPHQSPRSAEYNVEAQNVFTVGSPHGSSRQSLYTATSQSPRRTENIASEQQHFAMAVGTQVSRQTESITTAAHFNMVGNRGGSNQNVDSAAPSSIRTENNAQVTENRVGMQHFLATGQTPRGIEIARGQMPASVAQDPSVEGNSNVQSMVDGPLRALHQLVHCPEPPVGNVPKRLGAIDLILLRYIYFFECRRKAQMAYIEQLKVMSRSLPELVKAEVSQFEDGNAVKFYALCKDLVRDLRVFTMNITSFDPSKVQGVVQSVYDAMKLDVPSLTKTRLYLMLEALTEPEINQYMNVPFLAVLYRHIMAMVRHIRSLTRPVPEEVATQNNLPSRDLFTPEQRIQLERQLIQYKTICTNQVYLFSMGNTLQSNLLRAHQNNQINKANQQSIQNAKLNQQNNTSSAANVQSRRLSGGSARVSLYDVPGPPNITVSGNSIPTVRSPAAPQQENLNIIPPPQSEMLRNMLLPSNQPGAGASSGSNLTVPSDVNFNSTVTATTSRTNQPDVPSNVFGVKPRSIAMTPRRNSSPSRFQFKQIVPTAATEGANENFRIRLPFTLPYDVNSSTSRTVSIGQHSPRPVAQNSGANPSMPFIVLNSGANPMPSIHQNSSANASISSIMQNSGATSYRISVVPNPGATPSRTTMVQNSGATPSRPAIVQNFGATSSSPNVVQNSGATPSRPTMAQNSGATPRPSMVQNAGATPSRPAIVQNFGATSSSPNMVQDSSATPSRPTMAQNSSATPRPTMVHNAGATPRSAKAQSSGTTPSRSTMPWNAGATPRSMMVQNAGATPSRSTMAPTAGATPRPGMVQHAGASPFMPSPAQNSSPYLSMPLLDEDVHSVNVPNLSHIESVARTPVYAPMPITHPLVFSPSPPPAAIADNNSSEVSVAVERIENAKDVVCEDKEAPSTSNKNTDEDSLEEERSKKEQNAVTDEDIETIDLTWLDDIDPEQLQNEIEIVWVKKEEAAEEEVTGEENCAQEPIAIALSPTDSGISSPNVQVEYNEQVFSDRTCICGKGADYVCGCRMAMYCSETCQLKDWKTHKEVCLKHNAKSNKDTTQNQ